MYEDKGMTAALIAATQRFRSLPEHALLEPLRRKSIKNSMGFRVKKAGCRCHDETQCNKISLVRPIELQNHANNEFKSLPFAYAAYGRNSKLFPYLEVVEFPIFSHKEEFSYIKFDEMNEKISSSYKTFVTLQQKQSEVIDLNRIRIQILRQIYDQSGNPGHITFTYFRNLHETMVKPELKSYVDALHFAEAKTSWEFHGERFVPIILHSQLKMLAMASWTLTAIDLGR